MNPDLIHPVPVHPDRSFTSGLRRVRSVLNQLRQNDLQQLRQSSIESVHGPAWGIMESSNWTRALGHGSTWHGRIEHCSARASGHSCASLTCVGGGYAVTARVSKVRAWTGVHARAGGRCQLTLLTRVRLAALRRWVFGLTGQAGSCMYMAPEVYRKLPYNEKVKLLTWLDSCKEVVVCFCYHRSILLIPSERQDAACPVEFNSRSHVHFAVAMRQPRMHMPMPLL